jgi:hypothetical protein
MSTPSPRPAPSPLASWGIALAAGAMLLIGGGTIVWSSREPDPTLMHPPAEHPLAAAGPQLAAEADLVYRSPLPVPQPGLTFHSVAYTVENGTRVVKIKVVENGDELVVDAATGRLLEARPSRSTAPPPVGKFAAPFDPMT